MRKPIYSMGVSLNGFIAGPAGEIDWTAPDALLPKLDERIDFELIETRNFGSRVVCVRYRHT